jgi:hypothetical protein
MAVVRLEEFLGRKVIDSEGQPAGRIEELKMRVVGDRCEIDQFLLGRGGMLKRLSIAHLSLGMLRLLGAGKRRATHSVDWRDMDLSDPQHPRMRVSRDVAEELDH